jgi:hypothetical protein
MAFSVIRFNESVYDVSVFERVNISKLTVLIFNVTRLHKIRSDKSSSTVFFAKSRQSAINCDESLVLLNVLIKEIEFNQRISLCF